MNRVSVNIIKILCNVDKLNFQLGHIMPHREISDVCCNVNL